MVDVKAILDAEHRVACRVYGGASVLRAAPDVGYGLIEQQHRQMYAAYGPPIVPPGLNDGALSSLTLKIDDGLSPGGWRLCDADGTLLHDCRAGTNTGVPYRLPVSHPARRTAGTPVAPALDPFRSVRARLGRLVKMALSRIDIRAKA